MSLPNRNREIKEELLFKVLDTRKDWVRVHLE
jgi:hypothetical protein